MSVISQVPVIASFTKDGKIRPLFFRYNEVTLKISAVISTRIVYSDVEFTCKCIDLETNTEKDVILLYSVSQHTWKLLDKHVELHC